jgi:hypothetical protein
MSAFRSPDEFREVMNRAFEIMSSHPDMGPRLREADTPQRFEFPDLELVVNVTASDENGDSSHNLVWKWSDEVEWDPEVKMTMTSEVANSYFQGKENIAMAIARRRIKTAGNVKKALAIVPITKPVFGLYRKMLSENYPHLVE